MFLASFRFEKSKKEVSSWVFSDEALPDTGE
jgi:hypothetical protein